MKRRTCLLALTLIAFAGYRSNGSAQSLSSLREIKIDRHTLLVLGGEMPSVADFCNWSGTTCNLKPGTFSGTKEMSLNKTKSGLISQFYFYYGVTSLDAVKTQIDDYTRRLGKPSTDSTTRSGDFDDRQLEWSDSATTFKLQYRADQRQAEASATLLDNALAGPVR
jgi:hypothetical protein